MKVGNLLKSQLKEIKVFNPKGKALKIYPLWLDSEERKIYWDIIINYSNLKSSTNIINCYAHKLKRNGHNFCLGQIGERKYDLVFIQSIDGAISINEQDSFVNLVSFSEVIFPVQIGFINRKDSFVITNTAYEVECYGYNVLATKKIGTSNNSNSQQIYHQWKVILGELVIKMDIYLIL